MKPKILIILFLDLLFLAAGSPVWAKEAGFAPAEIIVGFNRQNRASQIEKVINMFGLTVKETLNLPAAWDISAGSTNIKIAILDTGIDRNHPLW